LGTIENIEGTTPWEHGGKISNTPPPPHTQKKEKGEIFQKKKG